MSEKKTIQYGISNFAKVSELNAYYVDKTIYIPDIDAGNYLFLLRPRRFGKSLFISMLSMYYDIKLENEFDTLFKGTWIHANPTKHKNKYFVLRFDFSKINKEEGDIKDAFKDYCNGIVADFMDYYKDYLPEDKAEKVLQSSYITDKIQNIARCMRAIKKNLIIFIDEYDNFTNTLLSNRGAELYQEITRANSFFNNFFRILKGITGDDYPALSKILITGITPVTMDDLTSAFNIGLNISLYSSNNSMLGFTEKDVSDMYDYFIDESYSINKDEAMNLMKTWYDNYRFTYEIKDTVYNTDGVLYFIESIVKDKKIPSNLIDVNLRMNYMKIKNLVIQENELNGNFDTLTEIITTGRIYSLLVMSFPFDMIKRPFNYNSMLYFLGLLTFAECSDSIFHLFVVPNETIKRLVFEYVHTCISGNFQINLKIEEFKNHLKEMSFSGISKPAFEFIENDMNKLTSIRDFRNREQDIKAFFLIYFGFYDFYQVISEIEMNKGYADIILSPNTILYKQIKYAYLIEFKYLPRKIKKKDLAPHLEQKIQEAKTQLNKYIEDDKAKKLFSLPPNGIVQLKKIIIVFHGWKMVFCEEH